MTKQVYTKLTLIVMMFFAVVSVKAQALVCNDQVNISVDQKCEVTFDADMFLEGTAPAGATISIPSIQSGVLPATPVSLKTFLNPCPRTVQYEVTDPATGNKCWGNALFEDKIAPKISIMADTLPCTRYQEVLDSLAKGKTAGNGWTLKTVVDSENCTLAKAPVMSFRIGTGDDCIGKTIVRTFSNATDRCGNVGAPASAVIYFTALSIDSVKAPDSVITISSVCGQDVDLSPAAVAAALGVGGVAKSMPTVGGAPIGAQSCNLFSSHAIIFDSPICGAGCKGGRKIIREWTVIDWCNNGTGTLKTKKFVQVIKAIDTTPPTITAGTTTLAVDPWTCKTNGTISVSLADNCDAAPKFTISGPAGVTIDGNKVIGAPIGSHTLMITASDCCNNTSTRNITLNVVDRSAPVAIVKEKLVLNLTNNGNTDASKNGEAKLFAVNVDNGSYDMCSAVTVLIRRKDIETCDVDNDQWRPFVKFCCEDVNKSHVVEILVTDAAGNSTLTWADVKVEGKSAATISCSDREVSCTTNFSFSATEAAVTSSLSGRPTVTGSVLCTPLSMTYQDVDGRDQCNVGTVTRTYRLKQGSTTISSCVQKIYVYLTNNNWYVGNVVDTVVRVNTCTLTDSIIRAYKPIVTNDACAIIGENIDVQEFKIEDGICKKWVVMYNYIDWCTGYSDYRQVKFSFADDTNPTIAGSNPMFEAGNNIQGGSGANSAGCTGTVSLSAVGNDVQSCNASGWLKWVIWVNEGATSGVERFVVSSNDISLLGYSYAALNTWYAINSSSTDKSVLDLRSRLAARTGTTLSANAFIAVINPTSVGATVTIPSFEAAEGNDGTVAWRVTDGCGNNGAANTSYMIRDKKAPTPYCLFLSTALMKPNAQGVKMVEIWAVDYDKGSFDNCTPTSSLLYTFDNVPPVASKINAEHFFKAGTTAGSSVEATAAEYAAGNAYKWVPSARSAGIIYTTPGVKPVKMTVWDARGNRDFCEVTLTVIDNNGGSAISGNLENMSAQGIGKVNVKVDAPIAEFPKYGTFDAKYTYAGLTNNSYTVTPSKNDDYNNGITTLDLVMMQRHILGVEKLKSADKLIAADINNDGKVASGDLIELRRLILGVTDKFSSNDSWAFIPANYVHADATNPFNAPRSLTLNVTNTINDANFNGIKIGDIDGNAVAAAVSNSAEARTSNTIRLSIAEQTVKAGDLVSFDVTSANFNNVAGLQLSASLKGLEIVDIKNGAIDVAESFATKNNTISMAFVADKAVTTSEVLFTVVAKATNNGQLSNMISLTSDINAEAYNANLETSKVELSVKSNVEGYAVYQNEPNPFKSFTSVSFNMPSAAKATVTLTDVTGKVVNVKTVDAVKGLNKVEYTRNDVPTKGVVYYTVSSGDFTATKAMIIVE